MSVSVEVTVAAESVSVIVTVTCDRSVLLPNIWIQCTSAGVIVIVVSIIDNTVNTVVDATVVVVRDVGKQRVQIMGTTGLKILTTYDEGTLAISSRTDKGPQILQVAFSLISHIANLR